MPETKQQQRAVCADCQRQLEKRTIAPHGDPFETWVHVGAGGGGERCDWTDPWSKWAEPA